MLCSFECFAIKSMAFFMVSGGRLELCPPFTTSMYLFCPLKLSYSLWQCFWFIKVSSSPQMKMMVVVGDIFFISSSIFKSYKSKSALSYISDFSFRNTHGNKHPTKHSGIIFGLLFFANSLHNFFILRKDESATIISTFPYFNALAAPILLPHKITSQWRDRRYRTTVAICYDSLTPNEINSASSLLPQPMKSKEARLKPGGRKGSRERDYTLQEELPWRQRIILQFLWDGVIIVSIIFLPQWRMTSSSRWKVSFLDWNSVGPE